MKVRESSLIEASKKGDAGSFGKLIGLYEDRIYRLAHSVCAGLPAEAEDVYQETFLTAFKKIGQFRSSSDLGTWLYRIASNLCWMRFRGKRKEPVVPILDAEGGEEGDPRFQLRDWAPLPDEAARKKELSQAVAKALGELPVEYRLVLTLRDIEGLSNEETARAVGATVAAVKSRLHRGRMFLRDRLDRFFEGKAS